MHLYEGRASQLRPSCRRYDGEVHQVSAQDAHCTESRGPFLQRQKALDDCCFGGKNTSQIFQFCTRLPCCLVPNAIIMVCRWCHVLSERAEQAANAVWSRGGVTSRHSVQKRQQMPCGLEVVSRPVRACRTSSQCRVVSRWCHVPS